MAQPRTSLGDAVAAAGTLALVVLLYGTPVLLAVILGIFRPTPYGLAASVDVAGEREAVVWMPPPPPEVETDDGDAAADAEPEPPAAEGAPVEAPSEPDAGSDLVLPEDAKTDNRRVRARPKLSMRTRRAIAAKRPRKPLTKEQQRRKEKWKKKKARMAKRKQCVELSDQIVQVSDTEYWFGRELVNCYRTHLEQFDRMGGAWWEEKGNGKRIGVGVSVSRSKRGEPARRAGWKTGDVIKSINGIRVRSMAGVSMAATQLLRSKIKVKRIRDGKEEVVVMKVVSPSKLEAKREELSAVASGD